MSKWRLGRLIWCHAAISSKAMNPILSPPEFVILISFPILPWFYYPGGCFRDHSQGDSQNSEYHYLLQIDIKNILF